MENAENHIGLVAMIAKPYAAAEKTSLMDSEVFSDGCLGLMNAIEDFDETLGFQFSTFASKCIRTAIHDGIKRRRRGTERRYEDGTVVKMHVSSECAELKQITDGTVKTAIRHEEESRFYDAMDRLQPKWHAVIALRLAGYGQKEIGELMGYSKQRAEQVEKLARRAIADVLTGAGNCVPADDSCSSLAWQAAESSTC